MSADEDIHLDRAGRIPVDPELLEPLGLIMWSAARLHHGIRDMLGTLTGNTSDQWFDLTLGAANSQLQKILRTAPPREDLTTLLNWSRDVAGPAIEARNGVAHAVPFTHPDGRQALRGNTPAHPERPDRYTRTSLRRIAGRLDHAAATMPARIAHDNHCR